MNAKKISTSIFAVAIVLIASLVAAKVFSRVGRTDPAPHAAQAKNEQTTAKKVVHITGEVNYEMYASLVDSFNDFEEMGSPDVEVVISSDGGFVEPGLEIIDLLEGYEGKKTAKVVRIAGSMAAIILQACDQRACEDNATIFVHNLYVERVELDQLRDERQRKRLIDDLEKDQERMYRIVMKRSGMSRQEVVEIWKEAPTLNAKEALELNLIDRIR
jgi:ATP-dependent protease ClpP protease subunit